MFKFLNEKDDDVKKVCIISKIFIIKYLIKIDNE